jgi:hypothetical protein
VNPLPTLDAACQLICTIKKQVDRGVAPYVVGLNGWGFVQQAAPAIAAPGAEWEVAFEGETYPAKMIVSRPQYGIVILKVSRQKPFPAVTLERSIMPQTARLALFGFDNAGTSVELPVNLIRTRRQGVIDTCDHVANDFFGRVPNAEIFTKLRVKGFEKRFIEVLDGVELLELLEEEVAVDSR